MADLRNRNVLSVLTEYRDDCVLFQTLLDTRYIRELAEHLVVLWIHLKRVGFPSPWLEDMIPVAMQIPGEGAAAYLYDFVDKGAMALDQMKIPTPPLPQGTPGYLVNFGWSRLAKDTIMGMAAEYDSGIPRLIFNDMLRMPYLNHGDIRAFLSPAAQMAMVPETVEFQRSLHFRYSWEYGLDFKFEMVRIIERDILKAGCVERVTFNCHGIEEMIVGLIVFKAPASYLQYVFSSTDGRITCADGKHFILRR